MDSQIEIKRETEFYQGFVRLKMSISNKAPSVITDVSLDFIFEEDLLWIDHYDPQYELKNGKILLGNLSGNTSKSIAVYFDPLMCTRGAEIECHVIYRDAQGIRNSVFMEKKLISVVCPIIKTDLDINVGRLKEFIENLPSKDSKIYEIQHGFDINKLSSIAREVIEKHDVHHVRTLKTKDRKDWEIWYYGKTKVTKADIVIKVSISSEWHHIELFAATETSESLTGILADFGRDLKHSIEFRASGKGNVINVTIRDSVIQRSNLIDFCSMDGTCPVNILVEDSVIQHSTLISEREEAKEESLIKEKEELDRLHRQKEEEELYRQKEEEEKRQRTQKEAEARLKQEMEDLRKQKDEEERKRREKEALERKQREEREQRLKEKGEKARKEKETQEKLIMNRDEAERKTQYEKNKGFSGKGILVFGLIFGILLISVAVILLTSNTPSENTGEDTHVATEIANNIQTESSENSDTYTNSIGMEFVKIPAGEFTMGSIHKVTIEDSYYFGKYEVTQEQWHEVLGSDPSYFEGDGDLPVEQVSWYDVQEFVEKLNEMEGTDKYRLPSEAEWEYACRAGTTASYSFGDDASKIGDFAWYYENSDIDTHPVGQKKPNPWGLYDMYGNVWEWCQDLYHSNYDGAPSDGSAWEEGSSSSRILRGGCFDRDAWSCRSATRDYSDPEFCSGNFGFRVVRTL